MIELARTAGPVFAIMLSPLLFPVLGWVIGRLADPFRPAPEPGIAERLAEQRRARAEQQGRHLAAPRTPAPLVAEPLRAA